MMIGPDQRARTRDVVIVGAVESTALAIRAVSGAIGWRVRLVVTLPPDRAARHSDFRDLGDAAREAGAEVLHTTRINDPQVLAQIEAAAPDLVFVVGWSQICGQAFLNILPGRVLGYHPAALPRLRGRAAIPWTILNTEPITAGTLFWIDEGMDSGLVVAQHFFHVAPDETAASLYAKHMVALEAMIAETLDRLVRGASDGRVQDERCATYAARRTQADGKIDWTAPTAVIDRLIRAVGRPYPGAFAQQGDDHITLWRARGVTENGRYLAAPGQIVERTAETLKIKTIDGFLQVDEWESRSGAAPKMHSLFE